jgi:hypothetical protein
VSERKFWNHDADEWESRAATLRLAFRDRLFRRLGKYCEDIDPAINIRGWLIERARSRRLRGALRGHRDEERAAACEGLAELPERLAGRTGRGAGPW